MKYEEKDFETFNEEIKKVCDLILDGVITLDIIHTHSDNYFIRINETVTCNHMFVNSEFNFINYPTKSKFDFIMRKSDCNSTSSTDPNFEITDELCLSLFLNNVEIRCLIGYAKEVTKYDIAPTKTNIMGAWRKSCETQYNSFVNKKSFIGKSFFKYRGKVYSPLIRCYGDGDTDTSNTNIPNYEYPTQYFVQNYAEVNCIIENGGTKNYRRELTFVNDPLIDMYIDSGYFE